MRLTAAVTPTVKVLVAAATLMGTRMTSRITGTFMKPPPTPASPDTRPATDIRDSAAGTRLAS